MNKQRKTSNILNVFQYDEATGIIGLNGVPVSGYALYLHTNINDGSVGIDSSANINAMYLLKNGTKQFEISYDTTGVAKIFRLLPYQSGSFFEIGNPSNAGADYIFISESTYGNVLIGPGIGNGVSNLTGATAATHKIQFNGAVWGNSTFQATGFKITGGTSSGFLKADGTVDTVGYLSGNQSITITGDVTGSGTTSIELTLANTAVTPGIYGSSTLVPVVTVDSKGRITNVSTASISGALTFTGDVTGSGTTGSSTGLTLANSGVTAGTYTKVTVDSKGRVTVGASATTSDIAEGTNLYYTDARVLAYLGANNYATQSYVGTQIANLVASSPAALDTLNELAAALGNDANFATTTATSLGNRLRIDIGTQGLTSTQQGYGRTNLGLGTAATSAIGDFATAAQGTKADSAFGWGNHASAGYLTISSAASTYQPLDADLTSIAGLLGTTGFLKKTAANTWALDTNTYLTSFTESDPIYTASSWYTTTNNAANWNTAYSNRIASLTTTGSSGAATLSANTLNIPTYTLAGLGGQPALSGTGFVKISGTTISYDNSTYLTGITSSQVTTALGYTPYNSSNPSGYLTSVTTHNQAWSTITSTPTTLAGYGISNGLYSVASDFTTAGAGWYRVATTNSDGRGYYFVELYCTGGNHNPAYLRIEAMGDWGNDKLIAAYTDLGFPANNVRITRGASNTFLEVYFTTTIIGASMRVTRLGFDSGITLYSGSLPGGGDTVKETLSITSKINAASISVAGNTVLHAGNYSSYALPLSGGTMTGSIAMGGNNITNVGQLSHANGRIILYGNLHIDGFNGNAIYLQYYNQGVTTQVYGPLNLQNWNISNADIIYANSSVRAPIFYDSQDTSYYVDPNSTSRLNTISSYTIYNSSLGSGYYFTEGSWGWRHQTPSGYIEFGPANGSYAHIYTNMGNFYFNVNDLYLNGNLVPAYGYNRGGDLYASRYYDANDTGYYGDFASISRMYGVAIRGDLNSTGSDNQIFFWGEGNSTTSAIGFKANGGAFGNPTGNGDGYNTYLTMDTVGRGWVFRRGVGGADFSSAYTAGWILNNGIAQFNASVRAPIFYDSEDTSYYLDPNGNSVLNTALFNLNASSTLRFIAGGTNASMIRAGAGDELYIGGNDTWQMRCSGGNILMDNGGYLQNNESIRSPIFYDSNDTSYYVDPNGLTNISRLTVWNASNGAAILVGGTDTSRVYADDARKAIVINASYYPALHLNANSSTNTNHGAYISMSGTLSAGGFRQWSMGIAGYNPTKFSIGFNDNMAGNGHYGVDDGWSGNDSHHGRLIIDIDGNVKIRGMLYVRGTSGGMTAGYSVHNATSIYMDRNIVSGTNLDTDLEGGGSYSSYGSGGTSWNAPFSYGGVVAYSFTSGIRSQFGFDIRHGSSDYGNLWYRTKNNVGYASWRLLMHDGNSPYAYNMNQYVRTSDSPTFNTIYANVDVYLGASSSGQVRLSTYNTRNLQIIGTSGSDVGILATRNGTSGFGFQIYGDGSNYGFLNYAWGSWDMRKNINGNLYLNNQSTYYLSHDVLYTYRVYGTADMRSPIYYDLDDTSYYCDPNSTSKLHTTNSYYHRNMINVSGDHPYGIYFSNNSNSNDYDYAIYRQSGAWSHPYPDLHIAFHTGIKIGAYYGYNGTRFYNNSDWATITASVNDGDNNFRGYYDIIAYASDRRLKENIQVIDNAIDKVNKLTGMTYQWNKVGSQYGWDPDTETREVGVFAQEVQEVLPEAVKLAPFDNNMGVSKSGENFLTVKYEKIVPLLIEAIKEQQKQIEDLRKQIDYLVENK